MRSTLTVVALLALGLVGCVHHIRPDAVKIDPYHANYPTAEFSACGSLWHGLGVCFLTEGDPYDSVALSIQGYFDGSIRVDSEDCVLHRGDRYAGSQSVRYTLEGPAAESCLVSFDVAPEYPGERGQVIETHTLKGHLWIEVLRRGEIGRGYTSRVSEGLDETIHVPTQDPDVRVLFRGCGTTFDKTIHSVDNHVDISLHELLSPLELQSVAALGMSSCVFRGAMIAPSGTTFIDWLAWGYDQRFLPLPTPIVELKKGKLCITADENVGVIYVDAKYVVDRSACIKSDATQTHIIRLITAAGRSLIGRWDPATQSVNWIGSVAWIP